MVEIQEKLKEESLIHRRPWVAPLFASVALAMAAVVAQRTVRGVPALWRPLVELAAASEWWRVGGLVALGAVGVALLVEQRRRFSRKLKAIPAFILMNRALVYGFAATLGALAIAVSEWPELWAIVLTKPLVAASWYAGYLAVSAVVGVLALVPIALAAADKLQPYVSQLGELRDTFDFVVGIRHRDDWERAESGEREYVTIGETGMYGNLLCLGMIGSGKTSQIADPMMLQALMKLPDDDERRPSVVVLDLKGNQSARYYGWAKALGRRDEFSVLRPDYVRDKTGKSLIATDRYCSFNALGGWDETDLLAIEIVDALESTKQRPSPDFFVLVQQEFLTHTLRVLSSTLLDEVDLGDLAAFTSSPDVRESLLDGAAEKPGLERSITYFREEFLALKREDQASLLRGLASQLTLLTNKAVESAFCPKRAGDARQVFAGWNEGILDKAGVLVFSCPPALYTDALSRLTGLLVLKSFQQAMLRRTDAGFGGNRVRPVVLMVDEAHAFLNRRLGDFMSVSREARVSTWLLTQSIDQIPPHYRGTVLSNTRTQVFLQVSAETAKEVSPSLGVVSEVKEQFSVSEGLQGARDGVVSERKLGDRKSLNASRSYVERERPRFAPDALQHLDLFRAVVHIFDGERQLESEMVETAPWYRLPFHPLNPLQHPNVRCKEGGLHSYKADGAELVCRKCGHRLTKSWEVSDFRAVEPVIEKLAAQRAAV